MGEGAKEEVEEDAGEGEEKDEKKKEEEEEVEQRGSKEEKEKERRYDGTGTMKMTWNDSLLHLKHFVMHVDQSEDLRTLAKQRKRKKFVCG